MKVENGIMYLTDLNETIEFKNPIAVRFFETLEVLSKEVQDGDLPLHSLEPILGKIPIIPSSPDMDARLEAADELDKYCTYANSIIPKIKTYATI